MAPPQQPDGQQQPPPQGIQHPVLDLLIAAGAASLLPPAAKTEYAAPIGMALTAAAIAKLTGEMLENVTLFAKKRRTAVAEELLPAVAREYPELKPQVVDDLVREEIRREKLFAEKMKARLKRDLPKALAITDPEKRREAVAKILDRERRYQAMREEAMTDRSFARAEQLGVKEASPDAAFWYLSPHVKQHTIGCLMLGMKLWPWAVLDKVHPPLHNGCRCQILTRQEAVTLKLLDPDHELPDAKDAMDRARDALKAEGLIEAVCSQAEIVAWLDEIEAAYDEEPARASTRSKPSVSTPARALSEAYVPLRYERGFHEGGQFRPKIGTPHPISALKRKFLHELVPGIPEPPAVLRQRRHGHVHEIQGRRIFVPHHRALRRQIGDHVYTSPAHSTRVYEDGKHIDKDTPSAEGRAALRVAEPSGLLNPGIIRAHRQKQAPFRRQIDKALRERSPDVLPVQVGDQGGEADSALRDAGFLETDFRDVGPSMQFRYVSPDGTSVLVVQYDRHAATVEDVSWLPRPAPGKGRELTHAPKDWPEFTTDLTAYARRIAREHGHEAAIGQIVADPDFEDHSGSTDWDGTIHLGAEMKTDIEAAAHGPLTDGQKRRVWAATQSAHHEALHAAFPIPKEMYDDHADASLEEALTEEVSHNEAVAALRRQGRDDVVAWAADHPQDWKVMGTYPGQRSALDKVLDQAEMAPEAREAYLRHLKLDVAPADRFALLGELVPGGESSARALLASAAEAGWNNPDFVSPVPLNAEPTTSPVGPEFRGRRLQLRDRVRVITGLTLMMKQAAGRWGMILGFHTNPDEGFEVGYDDGDGDTYVSVAQLTDAVPTNPRLPGSAAGSFENAGVTYREGDTVAYESRDGTSTARIERIIRAGPGGWAAEAITTGGGTPGGTRATLTSARVGSTMRKAPSARVPLGTDTPVRHQPLIRLEDKAALRGTFDLGPGTSVARIEDVAPRRRATLEERANALRRMQGGPANPVLAQVLPDGTHEVEHDGELAAARQLGLKHLAVAHTDMPRTHEPGGEPEPVPSVSFHVTHDLNKFNDNLAKNTRAANLTIHGPGDDGTRTMFLSASGKSGFALDATGDMQNVHNDGDVKGAGKAAVVAAVEAGARTLDAYDGFLPRYYSRFGFKEVVRQEWDDEYAPPGWDPAFDHPDVVHMAYEGGDRNTLRDRVGTFTYEPTAAYTADWDEAKRRAQANVLDRVEDGAGLRADETLGRIARADLHAELRPPHRVPDREAEGDGADGAPAADATRRDPELRRGSAADGLAVQDGLGARPNAPARLDQAGRANPAAMSPAVRRLKSRWAKLDRDLLPFAGEPRKPTARRIVREQKAVTKQIHHTHAVEGEKAKKGGGDTSDVVVVGAGPAGLSAAIYGASEGLDTLLLDSDTKAGGQARHSSRIENVVGFPTGVTGTQFATMGLEQAERLGADTRLGVSVRRMAYDPQSGLKHLMLSDGSTIHAKAVVIAGGVQFRKMSFEGATDCPDIVYGDSEALKKRSRGKPVVIVGGANSAGQAAIDTAAKVPVTMLLRHGEIGDKMSSYLVDQIESDPNINVEIGEVASVQTTAANRMASVTLKDGKKIPCGALGLFIGAGPETDWADVERDDHGYVIVGHDGSTALQTSVPGVFAAGDVRAGSIHRVITAAADGAAAVAATHDYLAHLAPAGRANPAAGPRLPVPAVTEADKWMDAMDELDQENPFTGFDGVAPDSLRGRENPPAGFLDVGPISTEALAPGDVFQDSSSAVYRVDSVKSARGGKLRFHLTRPAHGKIPEDAVGSHTFEKGEKAGFRLLKPDTRRPLTNGLDFYKATMSQLQWKTHPDAQVTFELHNRSKTTRIADYVGVAELQERLDAFKHGWSSRELAYLGGLKTKDGSRPLFDPDFIGYLRSNSLPPITVGKDDTGELTVKTTGPWPLVTFWETVALSTTNDVYFENYAKKHHLNLEDLKREGDRRLTEKIKVLHEHPEIKLAEFGTRRRFGSDWQHHVIDRLQAEAPENYLGTSNIAASDDNGTSPIGSYAHEVEMVYAALADKADGPDVVTGPATATEHVLDDWRSLYGEDLGIALTDTFTTAAFFHAFTQDRAEKWSGLRQDSGDPVEFGERAIKMYESYGIDPKTKTILFSDSLDTPTMVKLQERFGNRVKVAFGVGTNLSNDLGPAPLNVVMKAMSVDGTPTVKLSDSPGKHTGPPDVVAEYEKLFTERGRMNPPAGKEQRGDRSEVLTRHIERVGPWGYHLAPDEAIPSLLADGIAPTGVHEPTAPSSVGIGLPRPDVAYISVPTRPGTDHYFDEENPIRVDLRKLDPDLLTADEDHGLDLHHALYQEPHQSWGELADRHRDLMDRPETVAYSLAHGSIAVYGGVPASAVELNPVYATAGRANPAAGIHEDVHEWPVAADAKPTLRTPDWASLTDLPLGERPLEGGGKAVSSGVVVEEPDGRVWLLAPRGGYGGYSNTFPKGRVEPGLTPQQNAMKEAFEETGLLVKIDGLIGDFEGDTTMTRYFHATRVGGGPDQASGAETEAVRLVTPIHAKSLLNRERDQHVLAAAVAGEIPVHGGPAGRANPAAGGNELTRAKAKLDAKRKEERAYQEKLAAAGGIPTPAELATAARLEAELGDLQADVSELEVSDSLAFNPDEDYGWAWNKGQTPSASSASMGYEGMGYSGLDAWANDPAHEDDGPSLFHPGTWFHHKDEPKKPIKVDAKKLWGKEIVADADGKKWTVRLTGTNAKPTVTLVPQGKGKEVTYPESKLPPLTLVKGAGGGGGGSFKPYVPPPPKVDDTGQVTLGGSPGGSQGARIGTRADGAKLIVKEYDGNVDRVATELLANAVYRALDVNVPEAGQLTFGGKPAVAEPLLSGEPGKEAPKLSRALARGFMADALVANWDVVGLGGDNLLWPSPPSLEEDGAPALIAPAKAKPLPASVPTKPYHPSPGGAPPKQEKLPAFKPYKPAEYDPDVEPVRLDQGGTFEFRAMGSPKPYGAVPTEVWTMAGVHGQGYGAMDLTPEVKKQGAAEIAEKLDPKLIDGLVDAAPFEDEEMRERIRLALKARVEWMERYSLGIEEEPKPLEGAKAKAALKKGQTFEILPEELVALQGVADGWLEILNEQLRTPATKGQALTKELAFLKKHLDAVTKYAKTSDDVIVYAALPAREVGKSVKPGAVLSDKGYLGLTTSKARATKAAAGGVVLVLTAAGQSHVFDVRTALGDQKAEPELLSERGARVKIVRVEGSTIYGTLL